MAGWNLDLEPRTYVIQYGPSDNDINTLFRFLFLICQSAGQQLVSVSALPFCSTY